jgi:hypothetical protein
VVTVRRLLGRLPGLRLLAAEAAVDREVRWVHVSELPDPTPYLRGAELVLSAGVRLPRGAGALSAYARRLAALPVAGLGFGVAPIHAQVPPALVAACEELALPLLEVPPSVPFIAISEALAAELEEQHLAELRGLSAAQRALVRAAVRPAPVPGVVRGLAAHLGAGVVFAGTGGRVAAGAPLPDEAALADVVARVAGGREEVGAALHDGGAYVTVQPVTGPERRSALVVARAAPLRPLERGIVSVGASVLSLIERGVPGEAGLHVAAALALAVAGEPLPEWEPAIGRAFGARPGQDWLVVACAPAPAPRGEAARQRWLARLRLDLATPLIADENGVALAVLPDSPAVSASVQGLAAAGNLVAMSAPGPWPQLPAATAQARQGLTAARITGRPVLGPSAARPGLAEAVDPQAARAFSEAVLAPVWQARPRAAADLLATARAWLARHGNWDATAAALGVHRNTVRNRVAVLSKLLGRPLDDPDARMELWFALRWSGPPVSLTSQAVRPGRE